MIGEVFRISFENQSFRVSPLKQGVQFVARHFAVHSRHNFVSRYYTVCSCLAPKFYSKHLDSIRAFEENVHPNEEPIQIESMGHSSQLDLIIKRYP